MSAIVAIDISKDYATFVAAKRGYGQSIDLLGFATIPLDELFATDNELESDVIAEEKQEHISAEEEASPDTDPLSSHGNGFNRIDLENLLGCEIDASLAVVSGDRVLYKTIALPFSNPKKIDQAAPLQVQDGLPFEIDHFIQDNLLLGKSKGGQFEILSSIISERDVAETLAALSELGADPKLMTTKASALSAIAERCTEDPSQSFGILEFSGGRCSLALFVEGAIRSLRDFSAPLEMDESTQPLASGLLAEINCSIARVERDYDQKISQLYVICDKRVFEQCRIGLMRAVASLDFSGFVHNKTPHDIKIDNLSWAIGLFAAEFIGGTAHADHLIDFRRGRFAYKPAWRNLWNAIQGEILPILLAFIFGIGWYGSTIYNTVSALKQVEDEFKNIISTALPGETIPYRREVSYLEDEIVRLEEQLRGMGSLASLSPLNSLKELSTAIGRDIDIDVEALNIAQSRLSMRGSVLDTPAVGRLSGALEKRKNSFCGVKVDPKGRVGASSRVKFSADIELCE